MVPACLMNHPTKKITLSRFYFKVNIRLNEHKTWKKKNVIHAMFYYMPSQPLVVEIEVIVLLIFEELSAKVKKYLNN